MSAYMQFFVNLTGGLQLYAVVVYASLCVVPILL